MCACTGRDDIHCMSGVQFTSPVAPPEIQYSQNKDCLECGNAAELVEGNHATPIFGMTKWCDYRCGYCGYIERLRAYRKEGIWLDEILYINRACK